MESNNNATTTHTSLTRQFLAMAFSPSQPSLSKQTTNTNVSRQQLPTPEEPMLDSFERNPVLPPIHTAPSPPESPAFRSLGGPSDDYGHHDRILYPELSGTTATTANRPLFESSQPYRWASPEHHSSPAAGSVVSSPPSRGHSPFVSDVTSISPSQSTSSSPLQEAELIGPVALYNRSPEQWYSLMRSQMEDHRRIQRLPNRQLPPINASRVLDRDPLSQRQVSLLGTGRSNHRIEKPRPIHKATPKPKVAAKAAAVSSPKIESAPKRSRRQAPSPDAPTAVGAWQQSATPKPRTRAAPSKKVDDKDYSEWASLEDTCPPTNSLDTDGKKLATTWNNTNSLNLDNDPDRDHLHPQEFMIASILRLKCNQYLASKRRIFSAKVKALKEGREFNKTSAQNCCTIDVNKASRLWMAFDNVGWFDDSWFAQYL